MSSSIGANSEQIGGHMRIGEVTDRTGVTSRMLRYYEQQGLLNPGRHSNGYRDYTDGDIRQIATIRDLSTSGVPTRFIKIVLDRQSGASPWTSRCDDILAGMVAEQISELDSKIACLTASRQALRQFLTTARGDSPHRRPEQDDGSRPSAPPPSTRMDHP